MPQQQGQPQQQRQPQPQQQQQQQQQQPSPIQPGLLRLLRANNLEPPSLAAAAEIKRTISAAIGATPRHSSRRTPRPDFLGDADGAEPLDELEAAVARLFADVPAAPDEPVYLGFTAHSGPEMAVQLGEVGVAVAAVESVETQLALLCEDRDARMQAKVEDFAAKLREGAPRRVCASAADAPDGHTRSAARGASRGRFSSRSARKGRTCHI